MSECLTSLTSFRKQFNRWAEYSNKFLSIYQKVISAFQLVEGSASLKNDSSDVQKNAIAAHTELKDCLTALEETLVRLRSHCISYMKSTSVDVLLVQHMESFLNICENEYQFKECCYNDIQDAISNEFVKNAHSHSLEIQPFPDKALNRRLEAALSYAISLHIPLKQT